MEKCEIFSYAEYLTWFYGFSSNFEKFTTGVRNGCVPYVFIYIR
jgi:hypothetical protein